MGSRQVKGTSVATPMTKPGKLLENPESRNGHSVRACGSERDGLRTVPDWAISSRARKGRFNDRAPGPLLRGEDTVCSLVKAKVNKKDYTNGSQAQYDCFKKTGSTYGQYYNSGSAYNGLILYSSDGQYQYKFKSGGGATGYTEKWILAATSAKNIDEETDNATEESSEEEAAT